MMAGWREIARAPRIASSRGLRPRRPSRALACSVVGWSPLAFLDPGSRSSRSARAPEGSTDRLPHGRLMTCRLVSTASANIANSVLRDRQGLSVSTRLSAPGCQHHACVCLLARRAEKQPNSASTPITSRTMRHSAILNLENHESRSRIRSASDRVPAAPISRTGVRRGSAAAVALRRPRSR